MRLSMLTKKLARSHFRYHAGRDQFCVMLRTFAAAGTLDFDAPLRDAFMNYLDQVYYPAVVTGPDGRPRVDPALVRPKLPHPAAV